MEYNKHRADVIITSFQNLHVYGSLLMQTTQEVLDDMDCPAMIKSKEVDLYQTGNEIRKQIDKCAKYYADGMVNHNLECILKAESFRLKALLQSQNYDNINLLEHIEQFDRYLEEPFCNPMANAKTMLKKIVRFMHHTGTRHLASAGHNKFRTICTNRGGQIPLNTSSCFNMLIQQANKYRRLVDGYDITYCNELECEKRAFSREKCIERLANLYESIEAQIALFKTYLEKEQ